MGGTELCSKPKKGKMTKMKKEADVAPPIQLRLRNTQVWLLLDLVKEAQERIDTRIAALMHNEIHEAKRLKSLYTSYSLLVLALDDGLKKKVVSPSA
jgi:hypothetical protein